MIFEDGAAAARLRPCRGRGARLPARARTSRARAGGVFNIGSGEDRSRQRGRATLLAEAMGAAGPRARDRRQGARRRHPPLHSPTSRKAARRPRLRAAAAISATGLAELAEWVAAPAGARPGARGAARNSKRGGSSRDARTRPRARPGHRRRRLHRQQPRRPARRARAMTCSSSTRWRAPGVERNLAWLRERHPRPHPPSCIADIRDADAVERGGRATADGGVPPRRAGGGDDQPGRPGRRISRSTSRGTVNLLEALRRRADAAAADLRQHQQGLRRPRRRRARAARRRRYVPARRRRCASAASARTRPLDFHTPYGCSKGAADQYVLDYARSFGVPTAVLRMSCIYGPRQMGTEDQGWVAHFLLRALAGEPITHLRRRLPGARHAACRRRGRRPISRPGGNIDRVARPRLQPRRRPGQRGQPAAADRRRSRTCSGRPVATRASATGARATSAISCPIRARAAAGARPAARRSPWRDGVGALARLACARTRAAAPAVEVARRRHEGRAGQPALALRAQHLFRLPRAASAARTRLLPRRCSKRAGHEVLMLDGHLCGTRNDGRWPTRSRRSRPT